MKPVIIFFAVIFYCCKNQNHKIKEVIKVDSINNVSDTTVFGQNDGAYDSIEKKILDTVSSMRDVKAFGTYLDTATKGQHKMVILVSKPDSSIAGTTDYSVQVGEDNGAMFVTHYHFYVNPVTLSIRYYDVIHDTIISLKEWQRTSVGKK